MDVTEFLIRRLREAAAEGRPRILAGVCGRAGSGKSTLVDRLAGDISARGVPSISYSGDWRFALDSSERKKLLRQRSRGALGDYVRSLNQFTWWDFAKIRKDLIALSSGKQIQLDKVYDRKSGRTERSMSVGPIEKGVILYESAILGGLDCLELLDVVILLNTPDAVCLERTLRRDSGRRSIPEIASRFLITTHSENLFLETLSRYQAKTVTCDDQGRLGGRLPIASVSDLPIPIDSIKALVSGREMTVASNAP